MLTWYLRNGKKGKLIIPLVRLENDITISNIKVKKASKLKKTTTKKMEGSIKTYTYIKDIINHVYIKEKFNIILIYDIK